MNKQREKTFKFIENYKKYDLSKSFYYNMKEPEVFEVDK